MCFTLTTYKDGWKKKQNLRSLTHARAIKKFVWLLPPVFLNRKRKQSGLRSWTFEHRKVSYCGAYATETRKTFVHCYYSPVHCCIKADKSAQSNFTILPFRALFARDCAHMYMSTTLFCILNLSTGRAGL